MTLLRGEYLHPLGKCRTHPHHISGNIENDGDRDAADFAVMFIESLCHTKGTWAGKPFELIDWQEQIIRDIFGTLK